MMNQDHAANVAAKVLPGVPPSNWRRTALDAAPGPSHGAGSAPSMRPGAASRAVRLQSPGGTPGGTFAATLASSRCHPFGASYGRHSRDCTTWTIPATSPLTFQPRANQWRSRRALLTSPTGPQLSLLSYRIETPHTSDARYRVGEKWGVLRFWRL